MIKLLVVRYFWKAKRWNVCWAKQGWKCFWTKETKNRAEKICELDISYVFLHGKCFCLGLWKQTTLGSTERICFHLCDFIMTHTYTLQFHWLPWSWFTLDWQNSDTQRKTVRKNRAVSTFSLGTLSTKLSSKKKFAQKRFIYHQWHFPHLFDAIFFSRC